MKILCNVNLSNDVIADIMNKLEMVGSITRLQDDSDDDSYIVSCHLEHVPINTQLEVEFIITPGQYSNETIKAFNAIPGFIKYVDNALNNLHPEILDNLRTYLLSEMEGLVIRMRFIEGVGFEYLIGYQSEDFFSVQGHRSFKSAFDFWHKDLAWMFHNNTVSRR